ncbi:MAG: hypothetical protein KFF49_10850, partial [Bacteroidales bacterium]|nr:hypothetical protein [Bacteroidales bacterium]
MKAPVIKYFLVLLLICKLGSADSSALYSNERNSTSRVSERIFFGGSFGLQLGTITNIQLSPVIGMWLLRPLSIAAGPTWQYYKDPLGKTSIYGGRSFMRLMFVRDISQFIP